MRLLIDYMSLAEYEQYRSNHMSMLKKQAMNIEREEQEEKKDEPLRDQ